MQPSFFLNDQFNTLTVHGNNLSRSLESTCCLDALRFEARILNQNLAECKVFVEVSREYQFKFLQGHYLSTAEIVSVVVYNPLRCFY